MEIAMSNPIGNIVQNSKSSPMPLVSVVLAVYNCEKYLGEAIDSIQAQTYQNWELLIIDDASTDSSANVAAKYAQDDHRIQLLCQPKNFGQTVCANLGIARAMGKYIARLDADDMMLPERLTRQVAYMESHPDVGLLGTAFEMIDEQGNLIATCSVPMGAANLKLLLKTKNPILQPSMIMSADCLRAIGVYTERYPYAEDYALCIKFAEVSKVENLDEVLTRYRILSSSLSRQSLKKQSWDVLRIRWDSIMDGVHPFSNILSFWKPLIYVLSPDWLTRYRFVYRERRDKQRGYYKLQ
jgi:glycosyltransferase involved in cell wall biosynthesis